MCVRLTRNFRVRPPKRLEPLTAMLLGTDSDRSHGPFSVERSALAARMGFWWNPIE